MIVLSIKIVLITVTISAQADIGYASFAGIFKRRP